MRVSNFDFLKDYDYDLWYWGDKLEHGLIKSPDSVVTNATRFLERVLQLLIRETGTKVDSKKEFYYKLDAVYRESNMQYGFKQSIYDAYRLRNKIHITSSAEIEKNEIPIARQLHKKLYTIAKKLYRDYCPDYDHFKGVPEYRPVEVDTSSDELELVDIPDFSEIIDINYDYCIICGEPNHSNYSLCCHKCNRVMDNANNFISVRNFFGKDAKFTKEDLIEFGIPEGYVNQFINSLVREDMLKVAGRYITFNNIGLDNYLSKIDNYINVCELITKFREDKITPEDIKKTREYREGSRKSEPFYQFFKITNREIIKKFERDLLTTEDIWRSIDYTKITENQLSRWYKRELGNYQRGNPKEAFIVFNDLLKREYLDLKRDGILDSNIKLELNVTDEIYTFWCRDDKEFVESLNEIKIDLLSKAITEGKTRDEIISSAGVTAKEYDNIVKVADFHDSEFAKLRNREIGSRKKEFVKYLRNNDLKSSCSLAKFTLNDFYQYYDTSDVESEFFTKTTSILMDKYLAQRRLGKTRSEAIEHIGIKEKYVHRWLSRSMYAEFKDEELKIIVKLIIRGFKQGKSLEEISKVSCVSIDRIETYLRLGARGDEIHKPLFDYYEENVIPDKLSKFLKYNETKSMREALKSAKLSYGELNKYYELGKEGDERFSEFYNEFFKVKKATYVYHYAEKGKSHDIAMRESQLTEEEYRESLDEIEDFIWNVRYNFILEALIEKKTSNIIAKRAGCTVEDLYDWYFKGKHGDEKYAGFYESFHKGYIEKKVESFQRKLDEGASISNLIRSNKNKITKKDVEIWIEHGLIDAKVNIKSKKQDDEEEDDAADTVKKVDIGKISKSQRNRSSLGRVNDNNYDVEELKRQILKK